ncbi:MAG: YhjD/YihY/BrkB family envelope integrity protein [Actinomycetales bacterium]
MQLRRITRATVAQLRGHDLLLLGAGSTFFVLMALVPLTLVAIRLASAVGGPRFLNDAATALAALLPDALGAGAVVRSAVERGSDLSLATLAIAFVPATLYVEGLRRAFGRIDEKDTVPGWRSRVVAVPPLLLAPLALLVLLALAPWEHSVVTAHGAGGVLLAGWVSLTVLWLLLTPAVVYLYRLLGPSHPGWRASVTGGTVAAAFVSGFLHGFLVFLTIPVDLGRPFGGLVTVGAAVVVGLWVWVLGLIVLVGYALTVALDQGDPRGRMLGADR